jgi:hypothetical protein
MWHAPVCSGEGVLHGYPRGKVDASACKQCELRRNLLPPTRVNTGMEKEHGYSGIRLYLGQPPGTGDLLRPVLGYATSDSGVCATAL